MAPGPAWTIHSEGERVDSGLRGVSLAYDSKGRTRVNDKFRGKGGGFRAKRDEFLFASKGRNCGRQNSNDNHCSLERRLRHSADVGQPSLEQHQLGRIDSTSSGRLVGQVKQSIYSS